MNPLMRAKWDPISYTAGKYLFFNHFVQKNHTWHNVLNNIVVYHDILVIGYYRQMNNDQPGYDWQQL